MRILYTTLLFTTILISSCKKDEAPAKQPASFHNPYDKALTVKVYGSEVDYYKEANVLTQATIAPGATTELDGELFQDGRQYYYDLNSDDYTISNWVLSPYFTPPPSAPNISANTYARFTYPEDSTIECYGYEQRSVFLGTNTKKNWILVDAWQAMDGGENMWNKLPAYLKESVLTINKDFTVTNQYKDKNNNPASRTMRWDVYEPTRDGALGMTLFDYPIQKEMYELVNRPQKNTFIPHTPGYLYLSGGESASYELVYAPIP